MKLIIDTKWLDAISDLDDSLRLVLLDGIFAYMEDREPLLGVEAFRIFCTLRPFLDEEKFKRIRLAERSRKNGMKGGRKTKTKNLVEPKKPTRFEDYLKQEKYQGRSERLLKLDEWTKKYVPYIYDNIPPLTNREFEQLMKKYNIEQVCDTLLQIENRKDLRKRYSSLYRTLLNWLKKDYGNS